MSKGGYQGIIKGLSGGYQGVKGVSIGGYIVAISAVVACSFYTTSFGTGLWFFCSSFVLR